MILRPGRNVWRIARAHRATAIIDAAAYFGAVRAALHKAERHVFIIGWDMHSQTRLVGPSGRADDGYPETFAQFLSALVERKPRLEVSLLLWDFALFYAVERELFPTYALRWNTPERVRFCLDNAVPFGSSQHQKLIVVDDAVAFTGGLDVTIRRWDTSDHRPHNPLRRDPDGQPYGPFHDVQMLVDGPAARALGELARARWQCVAHEDVPPVERGGDPWPDGHRADFTEVDLGIARTQPAYAEQEQVREIEGLFLDTIAAAERSIYIENQFLTCSAIAKALAARMQERPALELLQVTPANHRSWIEAHTMRNGRIHFMQILREAGVADRVRLVGPVVRAQGKRASTMVHSKVMVVDDRLLHIGSANLNNRSMGTDTECDLVIEAGSEKERAAVIEVRNRLIADHCGATAGDVAAALAADQSLLRLPERGAKAGHALVPIDDGKADDNEFAAYLQKIADPEQPIGLAEFTGDLLADTPKRSGGLVKIAAVALAVLALVLAWQFTPLADFASLDRVRGALGDVAQGPWQPLVVVAAFVGASLFLFPVTVLIAATAATFGPWLGFTYAAIGTMSAALVTYALGALIGRQTLRDMLGPRLNRIRDKIRRRGVIAVALIRLVPVAPFTVVNLAAGAGEIRLIDFVLGTLVGMLPGMITLAALGHQVTAIIAEPSATALGWLAVAVAAWIALSFGLQAAVSKFESKRA